MSHRLLSALIALAVCACCCAGASAAVAYYHVTDLGTLGSPPSLGLAINASGQVTGGSSYSPTEHAFVYTA